jgi:hypothetical protein
MGYQEMLQKEAQTNQAMGDVEGVGPWGTAPWLQHCGWWHSHVGCNYKKERRKMFAYLISLRHQIIRKSVGKFPLAEAGH